MSKLKELAEEVDQQLRYLATGLASAPGYNSRHYNVPIEHQLDELTMHVQEQGKIIIQMAEYLDRVAEAALQEFDNDRHG